MAIRDIHEHVNEYSFDQMFSKIWQLVVVGGMAGLAIYNGYSLVWRKKDED